MHRYNKSEKVATPPLLSNHQLNQVCERIPPAHCSYARQINGYFWFAFVRLGRSNTAKRVSRQGFQRLSVRALVITLTELRAMAAPATTGLR
jgi:hypothetical protein